MLQSSAQLASAATGERLLRLNDVEARTGLRKSSIYLWQKNGTFPAGIRLGPRAVAWPESEIANWIAEKIRSARGVQP